MNTIEYRLNRFNSGTESTLGVLHKINGAGLMFRSFTLEDQHQAIKIPGETRIPAGRYEIKLRTEGGMHSRYADKYPWHRGMLWLQNVPGFEWVYLHPGTTDRDSEGCILLGYVADSTGKMSINKSQLAYEAIYREMAESHLTKGDKVFLDVVDMA